MRDDCRVAVLADIERIRKEAHRTRVYQHKLKLQAEALGDIAALVAEGLCCDLDTCPSCGAQKRLVTSAGGVEVGHG
jgi:hypothetical protein